MAPVEGGSAQGSAVRLRRIEWLRSEADLLLASTRDAGLRSELQFAMRDLAEAFAWLPKRETPGPAMIDLVDLAIRLAEQRIAHVRATLPFVTGLTDSRRATFALRGTEPPKNDSPAA